jgi:hypothetical protein
MNRVATHGKNRGCDFTAHQVIVDEQDQGERVLSGALKHTSSVHRARGGAVKNLARGNRVGSDARAYYLALFCRKRRKG